MGLSAKVLKRSETALMEKLPPIDQCELEELIVFFDAQEIKNNRQ